jgi:hypothetical protein
MLKSTIGGLKAGGDHDQMATSIRSIAVHCRKRSVPTFAESLNASLLTSRIDID